MSRRDPGRAILEDRVVAMTAEERALEADRMRFEAFQLAWSAADERGIDDALEQALFVLGRLYPEMPQEHVAFVRAELTRRRASGEWHGVERPVQALASRP